MRKTTTKILSLLLSAALLSGCGMRSRENVPLFSSLGNLLPFAVDSLEELASPEEKEPGDGIHAEVDFADMEWYRYNLREFNSRAKRLVSTKDEGEAEDLYTWLLTEYKRLQTLNEIAWINFYEHGTSRNSAACQTSDEQLSKASDTLRAAVADRLNGKWGEAFAAFLGEETNTLLSDYEEMTDREAKLANRETELQLQYNELIARTDLTGEELGQKAGSIFLELVEIRNEISAGYGFDSYADYAYAYYYGRDFTAEDGRNLCQQIKPYAREYFADCCYCSAFYKNLGKAAQKTPEELLAMLREYAPRISPAATEAEAYMERRGLYLLGDVNDIAELGFTATLPLYNAPFLYNSLYGDIYDIQSMFHEFGHFYDAYINIPANPLTTIGSYDIFEIHSTGLEALSYSWYDEIFGNASPEARIYCLDGLIGNVVSGCIYDEFQQYVYAHPELTAEELGDVYLSIREEYGQKSGNSSDRYQWIYVSHNFENPFYYISYAVSALASLQLWTLSQQDFDAAMELYNRLVEQGAYEVRYCQLLRDLGMTLFTEDLDACIAEPFHTLQDMCLAYDGVRPSASRVH